MYIYQETSFISDGFKSIVIFLTTLGLLTLYSPRHALAKFVNLYVQTLDEKVLSFLLYKEYYISLSHVYYFTSVTVNILGIQTI